MATPSGRLQLNNEPTGIYINLEDALKYRTALEDMHTHPDASQPLLDSLSSLLNQVNTPQE